LGRKSCPLALPLKPELMSAEFFEIGCRHEHKTNLIPRGTGSV
jgi:hypothetical protein